jgi:DNA polymerase-3 subunit beta
MSVTITVNHAELKSALAFTSLGLPSHPVVPVLGAVRVSAGPAGLELGAFDYETHAAVTVPGDTAAGNGGTLVNGAELTAAVGSLPAGKGTDRVTVTIDGDGLSLLCDGWQAPVEALPAEAAAEYPAFPPLPPLTGTIDSAVFARSATRTAACAGTDDTLPVLTRVHMTASKGTLTMAATDRYRLAMDEQPFAVATEGVNQIPAGLLVKFAKACDKAGKVSVHLGDGDGDGDGGERVALSDGTRTLITRAGIGEFINYRKMFAGSEYPTSVTADAAALVKVIARAGKVTGKNERMGFAAGEGGVTVTATRDGKVTGTQTVTATVTGPAVETGFNPAYLASVLSGISGDAVIGLQADVKKPARVTSADGFTAIVVPVRVAE